MHIAFPYYFNTHNVEYGFLNATHHFPFTIRGHELKSEKKICLMTHITSTDDILKKIHRDSKQSKIQNVSYVIWTKNVIQVRFSLGMWTVKYSIV